MEDSEDRIARPWAAGRPTTGATWARVCDPGERRTGRYSTRTAEMAPTHPGTG
ncbi:hypothetical protein Q3A86_02660 [Streptomyces sp. NBUA17]|uniref:hypothetical protein n=1 Tax=Streptomyces sp. NBUA17 TaxID=3062275 RepID=UPI0037D9EEB0